LLVEAMARRIEQLEAEALVTRQRISELEAQRKVGAA
jgi:hypothetical protein